ncbi:MAG: flagellar biosynthesis anti-sigma factor FlgM [Candidatus Lambdaproteobacteria bacterium]|nr:flagellar biosynthesis anti-sigma factor FlgM [Candidatus Lambdaproteobacteria bacterium]
MKVTGQHPPKVTESTAGKGQKIQQQGGADRSQEARETEHAASQPSLTMHKIKARIRETADIQEAKVAELRERIRSGNYTVDADRLASRMIDQTLEEDLD